MTSDPIARYLSQQGATFDRKSRLRIMSSSEVLDTALRVYQRFGLTFLRLTVSPALLCLASLGFVLNYILPDLFTTKSGSGAGQMLADVAGAMLLAVFVGGPMFLLGFSYTTSLVVQTVSDYLLGRTPDADGAAVVARSTLGRLFQVNLKELCLSVSGIAVAIAVMAAGGFVSGVTPDTDAWAGIVSGIGLLGMIVGAVVFLVIIAVDALAAPVAILENAGPKQASRRSRTLLKRSGYHASGTGTIWSLYALLFLVILIVSISLAALIQVLGLNSFLQNNFSSFLGGQLLLKAFNLLPSFFLLWTLMPIWASVITIVYYDRKIRLEGFDIDVLALEITRSNPAVVSQR